MLDDESKTYCTLEKTMESTTENDKMLTNIEQTHLALKMSLPDMIEVRWNEESDSSLNTAFSDLFVKQSRFFSK